MVIRYRQILRCIFLLCGNLVKHILILCSKSVYGLKATVCDDPMPFTYQSHVDVDEGSMNICINQFIGNKGSNREQYFMEFRKRTNTILYAKNESSGWVKFLMKICIHARSKPIIIIYMLLHIEATIT